MQILNGNGDGTFQPRVMYLPPPPISVGGGVIVAANLNGDTKPDIALARIGSVPRILGLAQLDRRSLPLRRPSAPTLLSPAQDATPAQPVTFDWTNVANATSYAIQIDNSSNFAAPLASNQIVSVSQVTIGGLPAGSVCGGACGRAIRPACSARSLRRGASRRRPRRTTLSTRHAQPDERRRWQHRAGNRDPDAAPPLGRRGRDAVEQHPERGHGSRKRHRRGRRHERDVHRRHGVGHRADLADHHRHLRRGHPQRDADGQAAGLRPSGQRPWASRPATVQGGAGATGTVFLSVGAPAGGLVVSLSSSNTAAATVPATVTVFLSSGTFPISTLAAETNRTTTITASANGISQTATMTVIGSAAPPPPTPTGLSVSPSTVAGGAGSTGSVTLSSAALAGGLVVFLSSSDTAVATVPPTMTVAGGLSSATFPVSTFAPQTTRTAIITASANGVSRTATLTVNGSATPPQAPTLSALSLSPATVQGGNSSTGTVTLSAAAPSGGAVITLSDNSAAANVPSSISVPGGATSANFTVTTTTVTASTVVPISALFAGVTRTASLTVTPQTAPRRHRARP